MTWPASTSVGGSGRRSDISASRACGGHWSTIGSSRWAASARRRGKGWYRYDDARTPTPDPEVVELIRTLAADAGIPQRAISDDEIVERSIYALVNEGARVLADGIAMRASDIDVIYVNGYGFPGWRGGPMFYADRVGLPKVLDRVDAFHRDHGDRVASGAAPGRAGASGSNVPRSSIAARAWDDPARTKWD